MAPMVHVEDVFLEWKELRLLIGRGRPSVDIAASPAATSSLIINTPPFETHVRVLREADDDEYP